MRRDPWYCVVSNDHIHRRAPETNAPNWCRYCLADMPTQTTPMPSPALDPPREPQELSQVAPSEKGTPDTSTAHCDE